MDKERNIFQKKKKYRENKLKRPIGRFLSLIVRPEKYHNFF